MNIKTKNYFLRPFHQMDLTHVFKGLSDPAVIPYYGVSFQTREETQVQMNWYQEIEKENTGRWRAICSHDDTTFFGAIGFNSWKRDHRVAEIGFWLLHEHWQKGIIKEVLPEMLNFGFKELNLHRVEAEVEPENMASKKVLTKAGFLLEGQKRDCEIKNGNFISLEIYSLLATDVPNK